MIAHHSEIVSTQTPSGGEISALLAQPDSTPAAAVILIHAFQGLTDEFKAYAPVYAAAGYVALAIDLYDGKVATDFEEGFAMMNALNDDHAHETCAAWVDWLREQTFCSGKVGTVGWCFGGRWSLNASIAAPVDATVVYYGGVDRPDADLKKLSGPVLAHFGEQDMVVPHDQIHDFEARMTALGHPLTLHWYDANHAFANHHAEGMYDEDCANQADARTFAFLHEHLS